MALIKFSDRPNFRSNAWAKLDKLYKELDARASLSCDQQAGLSACSVFPALNISEDPDNVYVRAEIPGIQPSEVELYIEGDTLTIKGERRSRVEEDKLSFHRREIEYGRFNRAVSLPTKIYAERISAQADNGILKITLPKTAAVKPKHINIDID